MELKAEKKTLITPLVIKFVKLKLFFSLKTVYIKHGVAPLLRTWGDGTLYLCFVELYVGLKLCGMKNIVGVLNMFELWNT